MKFFSTIALVSGLFGTATLAAPAGVEKRDTVVGEIFPNYLVPINQSAPNTVYGTKNTFHIEYSGNDATSNEVRMFGMCGSGPTSPSFLPPPPGIFLGGVLFSLPLM